MSEYRSYIIHTTKRTPTLDDIAALGGRIYSKTVSLIRKVKDSKGFWLSQSGAKKYLKFMDYPCHAHSVQAIIDDYYGALKSFFQRQKKDPKARPPYKHHKFHTFIWRASGISVKGNTLRLSMGKGRPPIILPVNPEYAKVPATIKMVYNQHEQCYAFHATYAVGSNQPQDTGSVIAIDMGEIHLIVSFDGEEATIYNGRFHRSIMQYRNKFLARINQKLSRCTRGSKRWKQLKATKCRVLTKLARQLKDCRHKITSRFVSACKSKQAQTIVMGDLKALRQSINYSKKSNQKLHQWPFSEIAEKIRYKAQQIGIKVETESEKYTSQTCPSCGNRKKPSGRNYKCNKCGWEGHRDIVGASNIWTKYQGWLFNPVVGTLVFPAGVRFTPHLCRLDSWSPFMGLMSKKPVKNG